MEAKEDREAAEAAKKSDEIEKYSKREEEKTQDPVDEAAGTLSMKKYRNRKRRLRLLEEEKIFRIMESPISKAWILEPRAAMRNTDRDGVDTAAIDTFGAGDSARHKKKLEKHPEELGESDTKENEEVSRCLLVQGVLFIRSCCQIDRGEGCAHTRLLA